MAQIDQIQSDVDKLLRDVDTLKNSALTTESLEEFKEEVSENYPDISDIETQDITITLTAIFDDGNNADGLRPLLVGVNIKDSLDETAPPITSVSLYKDNNWTATLTIPYDLQYELDISTISGYTVTPTLEENIWNINLVHELATVDIDVSWIYSEHPSMTSFTVELLQDGVLYQTQTMPRSGGLFVDLPKYYNTTGENGGSTPYRYTVNVPPINGYNINFTGGMDIGYTIRISKKVGEMTIHLDTLIENSEYEEDIENLYIVVIDAHGVNSIITYNQFINGVYECGNVDIGMYVIYSTNHTNLISDATLQGDSIPFMVTYVEEDNHMRPHLYYHYINEDYEPPDPQDERINIPVTIVWNDSMDADLNRPSNVTVRLFADGSEVDDVLVDNSSWAYEFTDMFKYSVYPTEIQYSIAVDPVSMYTPSISGYTATFNYNPETISKSIGIVWDDDNDSHGARPSSVRATLSNGLSVLLSPTNNWVATISDLHKYYNHQERVYSWSLPSIQSYMKYDEQTVGNATTITMKYYNAPTPPL